ncbi:tryptophan--tRNA ligase [Candidatus Woesearchaeota archaeon]|nr:tryptophan--tRNA ligase [Candidatus Woesearchaeota archaeon]
MNDNITGIDVDKESDFHGTAGSIIDPWGSSLPESYEKMVKDFGLEVFNKELFPNPNRLMRRGVVFAGRDLNVISKCIRGKKPYYVLSGIMPTSENIHFGTKMVIENIKYFQENGAKETYVLIADLEASATRGVTLEEARDRALKFHIPAYIALGLDPKKTKFYFQSQNIRVLQLGYEFAKKITLNEFRAIYGNADPGRIMAAVAQAGDMLLPQLLEKKPIPGIIPVGVDQDPHLRLARDLMKRFKTKYNFSPLASIYHKFTPSLDGGEKMSKSKPEGSLEIPEEISSAKKKILKAMSGGRDTLEEHRKLGAIIEKDMTFELLKQHLVESDKELNFIYEQYKSGKMTSGEIKNVACDKISKFMKNFSEQLEIAKKKINGLNFIKF